MKTESNNNEPTEPRMDLRKATGRLIATVGAARILRHRDGTLDVSCNTPNERNAALAWMYAISPELAGRVRRCSQTAG